MTANDELLPCPFCGSEPKRNGIMVYCPATVRACPIKDELIAEFGWNTRTQPYTHEQVMALVEAAKKHITALTRHPRYILGATISTVDLPDVLRIIQDTFTPFTQHREQPNE